MQCSPGFRVLTHVLSSSCWRKMKRKNSFAATAVVASESWGISLPSEILDMILVESGPKDVLSFCQASCVVERWYYSSIYIPQLGDFQIRSFDVSIPCCGQRDMIAVNSVCCSSCYTSRHARCVGLDNPPLPDDRQYLCPDCRESTKLPSLTLDPGGVTNASRRKNRGPGCRVKVDGMPKLFQLRLSKPSHLRPERRLLGSLVSVPPLLVDYTIRFSGEFSGLAYEVEDDLR
ncbi:hypothetical protein VTN77DRAFT_8367 [Rasamsonia byssochlamydoides]|uniref:uncharacterized protein n=1 Tax=Rasamsonia byssochlamydoides TaxID=89139 RepID=UPI003744066D